MKPVHYNQKYPVKHLSIRVPWHDNCWNGSVCLNPKENSSCLVLKNCSLKRNDELEQAIAGKLLKNIKEEEFPPCVSERGMFLSDFDIQKTVSHPYAKDYNQYYKHLQKTPVNYKAYSAPAVPFYWMLPDNAKEKAIQYVLNFDNDREPFYRYNDEKLNFTKSWIQDYTNQKSLFDCFFEHIKADQSLALFYAKEVPFIEDNNRILIGIGEITSILQSDEYNMSEESDFKAMPWEHIVSHTIRNDYKNGFIFPYHEALEYQKENPNFDPALIAVIIPSEFKFEFSYASEHVSNDCALYILRDAVKKIELAKSLSIGKNNDYILSWLHRKINEIEILRGDYPGLGSALSAFGLERGHFIAQYIFTQIKNNECPWSILEKAMKNPFDFFPDWLSKDIYNENLELWNHYLQNPSRYQLLQLLSRFSLSIDQAKKVWDQKERSKHYQNVSDEEILNNPYVIYEISNNTIMPISYSIIDIGLMLNRDKNLLPYNNRKFHPLCKERIRALTIMELEKQSENGHTVYPEDKIITNIANLPIEPKCELNADYFNIASSIFNDKIVQHQTTDRNKVFQLQRLNQTSELIYTKLTKRLKSHDFGIKENWAKYLENEIQFDHSEMDILAKEEKVKALSIIANKRFSVLVGQAGSGKTTLLAALASIETIKNGGVLFLAPTGKARVRMEEQAKKYGVTAKTIAQFLYPSRRFNGDTQTYQLNDSPKKESGYKTVIIDECSMLTEEMLAATIQNLESVERLVLVGDYRQLPPIGAGKPFFDIITYLKNNKSENCVELTTSSRQKEKEGIKRYDKLFASLFGGGDLPKNTDDIFQYVVSGQSHHIKFHQWNNESDFEKLFNHVLEKDLHITDIKSFNDSLGANKGIFFNKNSAVMKVEDWQILSPIKSKIFGVKLLNRLIKSIYRQEELNWTINGSVKPGPFGNDQIVYGDKVINLKNHIHKEVYPEKNNYIANGEIGITVGHCKWENKNKGKFGKKPYNLEVEFTTQRGMYYKYQSKYFSEENGDFLELAYALTIHKAQGSQFKTVIIVIPENCFLLSRELIYTAVTRHVDKIILLVQGQPSQLFNYTNDYHSTTAKRITNLFYKPNITKVKDLIFEKNLIHCTSDGKMLRSKSEVIIYEMLLKYGLKPQYEYKLEINGETRRPDFYINDDDSGVNYYWEHLGMLNDPEYYNKWLKKQAWYEKNNILPLERGGGSRGTLIISKDGANGSISVKEIDELIKSVFEVSGISTSQFDEIKKLTEIIIELRNDFTVQITSLKEGLGNIKKAATDRDAKIDSIYSLIDKDLNHTNIQSYYAQVRIHFPGYSRMLDSSNKYIASALYIKEKLDEVNAEDYSPYILQFARSIENEFLNRLFVSFYDKLGEVKSREDFLKIEFDNPKSNVFAKTLDKQSEKFTMGTMETVMGFIWKEDGNSLKTSPLLQMFREHVLDIMKPEYFAPENLKLLNTITQEYRNKAAHVDKIDKQMVSQFDEIAYKLLNNTINNYI